MIPSWEFFLNDPTRAMQEVDASAVPDDASQLDLIANRSARRGTRALSFGETEAGLEWLRVAIRLYEILDHLCDEQSIPNDSILAAMHLRARAIRELGPDSQDSIRDPEIILRWISQTCGWLIPHPDGVQQGSNSKQQLRDAKKRLLVLGGMLASVEDPTLSIQIESWNSIATSLP